MSEVKVDTISERTADNGVAIDSITLKDGAITLSELSSTPSDPTSGTEARLYMKGDKLIAQYNDGGTVRYKYLDLTGTGVTWTHSTSAP